MLNVVHHALKSVVKSSPRRGIFSWPANSAARSLRGVRSSTALGAVGRARRATAGASVSSTERPTGPLDPSSGPVVTSSRIGVLRDPSQRWELLVADDRRAVLRLFEDDALRQREVVVAGDDLLASATLRVELPLEVVVDRRGLAKRRARVGAEAREREGVGQTAQRVLLLYRRGRDFIPRKLRVFRRERDAAVGEFGVLAVGFRLSRAVTVAGRVGVLELLRFSPGRETVVLNRGPDLRRAGATGARGRREAAVQARFGDVRVTDAARRRGDLRELFATALGSRLDHFGCLRPDRVFSAFGDLRPRLVFFFFGRERAFVDQAQVLLEDVRRAGLVETHNRLDRGRRAARARDRVAVVFDFAPLFDVAFEDALERLVVELQASGVFLARRRAARGQVDDHRDRRLHRRDRQQRARRRCRLERFDFAFLRRVRRFGGADERVRQAEVGRAVFVRAPRFEPNRGARRRVADERFLQRALALRASARGSALRRRVERRVS